MHLQEPTDRKRLLVLVLVLVMVGVVSAGVFLASRPGSEGDLTPAVIRVGVLPDMDREELLRRYKPLLDHLSAETGFAFELATPESYDELVKLFRDGAVDLAYFGGLTFVRAHVFHGAQPLVMRDVDTRFTSYFLARPGNLASGLGDFKGRIFSFGSRLSTSGHLMPRQFLKTNKEIEPEAFFGEVRYSGAHDKTAYWVRDGEVDLGVANSEIIKAMHRDGRLKKGDLRVLWETPPYPDYVWAVRRGVNETIMSRLRDAFLSLEVGNRDHAGILLLMGAGSFLPAGVNDFMSLKLIAESLGLLEPAK